MLLHQFAAAAHQAHRLGQTQHTGRNGGRILTEAVSRDQACRRKAFCELGTIPGHRGRQHGRRRIDNIIEPIGFFGRGQGLLPGFIAFRNRSAIRHHIEEKIGPVFAKGMNRFFQGLSPDTAGLVEVLGHAHGLRGIARKSRAIWRQT